MTLFTVTIHPLDGLCCTFVSCSESLEVKKQSEDTQRKNEDDGERGEPAVESGVSRNSYI